MRKTCWVAVLALVGCGNAWAEEPKEGEHCDCSHPHSHWYLDLAPSWYGGVAVGQGTFQDWSFSERGNDPSMTSRDFDNSDTGLRVLAGVDFGQYLGLELGYADFGEATFRGQNDGTGGFLAAGPVTETVTLESFDLTLLGKLPLTGDLDLFGRVGVLRGELSYGSSATSQCCGPLSFNETDYKASILYGAGIRYDGFGPVRVVAEYATTPIEATVAPDGQIGWIGFSLVYLFRSQ